MPSAIRGTAWGVRKLTAVTERISTAVRHAWPPPTPHAIAPAFLADSRVVVLVVEWRHAVVDGTRSSVEPRRRLRAALEIVEGEDGRPHGAVGADRPPRPSSAIGRTTGRTMVRASCTHPMPNGAARGERPSSAVVVHALRRPTQRRVRAPSPGDPLPYSSVSRRVDPCRGRARSDAAAIVRPMSLRSATAPATPRPLAGQR